MEINQKAAREFVSKALHSLCEEAVDSDYGDMVSEAAAIEAVMLAVRTSPAASTPSIGEAKTGLSERDVKGAEAMLANAKTHEYVMASGPLVVRLIEHLLAPAATTPAPVPEQNAKQKIKRVLELVEAYRPALSLATAIEEHTCLVDAIKAELEEGGQDA